MSDQQSSVVAPMALEVLDALKGSIAKWEKIVAGTGKDGGTGDCPLCALFHPDFGGRGYNCGGCPVRTKSTVSLCSLTPYVDYAVAKRRGDNDAMALAAQAELDFLKSLLPESAS